MNFTVLLPPSLSCCSSFHRTLGELFVLSLLRRPHLKNQNTTKVQTSNSLGARSRSLAASPARCPSGRGSVVASEGARWRGLRGREGGREGERERGRRPFCPASSNAASDNQQHPVRPSRRSRALAFVRKEGGGEGRGEGRGSFAVGGRGCGLRFSALARAVMRASLVVFRCRNAPGETSDGREEGGTDGRPMSLLLSPQSLLTDTLMPKHERNEKETSIRNGTRTATRRSL